MKTVYYTTGAYITKHKFEDGRWGWVVDRIEEEVFDNNGESVGVYDTADTEDGLMYNDEEAS